MFDGDGTPSDPDWKAVAQLVMQQRDRAEQRASNLEVDLTLAQAREAALRSRIAELTSTPDLPLAPSLGRKAA